MSVDALEVFDLVLQCVPRMDGQDKASSLNESKIGSDRPNGSFIAGRRGSDLSVPCRGEGLRMSTCFDYECGDSGKAWGERVLVAVGGIRRCQSMSPVAIIVSKSAIRPSKDLS